MTKSKYLFYKLYIRIHIGIFILMLLPLQVVFYCFKMWSYEKESNFSVKRSVEEGTAPFIYVIISVYFKF